MLKSVRKKNIENSLVLFYKKEKRYQNKKKIKLLKSSMEDFVAAHTDVPQTFQLIVSGNFSNCNRMLHVA